MSLSHRQQPDYSDRFDGEIGGIRFMVVFGADGKVVRGERSKVPTPELPTVASPAQPKPTPYQLLTGAWGILKAKFGIKVVPDAVYKVRRKTCTGCAFYDFGVCGSPKQKCGCYLAATIRLQSESCPEGLW